MGDEPFCVALRAVEDWLFFNILPLFGAVVFTPAPLAAYRIRKEAMSEDRLRMAEIGQLAINQLDAQCNKLSDQILKRAFKRVIASKRRFHGKILLGAGRIPEARKQLKASVFTTADPASVAKALGLYCLSYMPARLQPRWPSSVRNSGA
jgi:hypothetical protein